MKRLIPNPETEIEDRINDLQDFEIKVNENVDRAKIFRSKTQKPTRSIKGSIVEDLEKFENKIYPQATPSVRHSFFFKGN